MGLGVANSSLFLSHSDVSAVVFTHGLMALVTIKSRRTLFGVKSILDPDTGD